MLKFILIAACFWILGVFGWAQILGSIQNIKTRSNLAFTLIVWIVILGVGAVLGLRLFHEPLALVVGYGISFVQVLSQGKAQ